MLICPVCGHSEEGPLGALCPTHNRVLLPQEELDRQKGDPDPFIGSMVAGRFAVVGLIGRGGFGSVYHAVQQPIGREVALKVMNPKAASDEAMRARFFREARVVGQLSHPSTVTLFDYGEDEDGLLFMVMEIIRGVTLRVLLHDEAPLAPKRAVRLATQILGALVEAHGLGLIHRDLKPPNIMLVQEKTGEERAKILDFGMAKVVHGDTHHLEDATQSGIVMGTPTYISPEQALAKEVGPPADIYSLGIVLFEMLSGTPPYRAPSVLELLIKHTQGEVPRFSEKLFVPEGLEKVIRTAMARKCDDRYPDAAAMLLALKEVVPELGEASRVARLPGKPAGTGGANRENPLYTVDSDVIAREISAALKGVAPDESAVRGRPPLQAVETGPPPPPGHAAREEAAHTGEPWPLTQVKTLPGQGALPLTRVKTTPGHGPEGLMPVGTLPGTGDKPAPPPPLPAADEERKTGPRTPAQGVTGAKDRFDRPQGPRRMVKDSADYPPPPPARPPPIERVDSWPGVPPPTLGSSAYPERPQDWARSSRDRRGEGSFPAVQAPAAPPEDPRASRPYYSVAPPTPTQPRSPRRSRRGGGLGSALMIGLVMLLLGGALAWVYRYELRRRSEAVVQVWGSSGAQKVPRAVALVDAGAPSNPPSTVAVSPDAVTVAAADLGAPDRAAATAVMVPDSGASPAEGQAATLRQVEAALRRARQARGRSSEEADRVRDAAAVIERYTWQMPRGNMRSEWKVRRALLWKRLAENQRGAARLQSVAFALADYREAMTHGSRTKNFGWYTAAVQLAQKTYGTYDPRALQFACDKTSLGDYAHRHNACANLLTRAAVMLTNDDPERAAELFCRAAEMYIIEIKGISQETKATLLREKRHCLTQCEKLRAKAKKVQ